MNRLTSPWTLGPLGLRNRLVMAPVKTAYGTAEGAVTDRHLHFYRSVAEGGVGLIILEPVSVTADGREHPKQLAIHRPDSVEASADPPVPALTPAGERVQLGRIPQTFSLSASSPRRTP